MKQDAHRPIRCAVYTRKSSDDGLDQTFNSLDAQREACEAYIASQRHEGWKLNLSRYDDGGLSGGNLERPALQQLLEDIAGGKVDMVVVYKIDRLTRSLADFARLIDVFDAADCSFVSVTQSFNTSTSMGRLTLNVLLSFAQFEREVTAERIRDKIAASKKKGFWMGGLLPLGYDQHPDPKMRTLVINESEARIVREIFHLYREHHCLRKVEEEVILRGYRSKRRVFKTGKVTGARPLSRGQINFILRNPVYIGRIRHKQETHEGLHAPIVDRELWDAVKTLLDTKSPRKSQSPSKSGALLTGRIFDEAGDTLTPSHAQKGNRRYRYYVSSRLLSGKMKDDSGWRLPARQTEDAVVSAVMGHLKAKSGQIVARQTVAEVKKVQIQLGDLSEIEVCRLIDRVEIAPGQLSTQLDMESLADLLGVDVYNLSSEQLRIGIPFQIRRRGVEAKLIIGTGTAHPDQALIRAIAQAFVWLEDIKSGEQVRDIAARYNRPPDKLLLRLRLAFLSPRIVEKILQGRQPPELTLTRLMKMKIPSDWNDQWRELDFDGVA